jgi:hypothetical protein
MTPNELATHRDIALEVIQELLRAREKFAPMASAHEGYAVILEELDELWEEIRTNPKKAYAEQDDPAQWHRNRMRTEAVQLAAMALRFIEDVCMEGTR